MRLANMVFVVVALFWPVAAQAIEVNLGVASESVYDSNVFRTAGNDKGDFSFRFSPTIRIQEQSDRLGADISYAPTYEVFTTFSDANALSHQLVTGLTYRFSDRTHAELQNRFRVLYVLNSGDLDTLDDGSVAVPDNDLSRDEMFLFNSTLSISHALSSRWEANTDIAFDLFDPRERRQSVASKSVSAFQNLEYTRDRSNIFGVGGGVIVQLFDEAGVIPGSDSYIFRIFARYTRNFGESTVLTLRAGPAVILTRQDDADFDSDSGSNDSSVNFFGDVSLMHRWTPQFSSTLSYNRSESTANGQGASTISDSASFLTVWRPGPLWDLSLQAGYVKRESPNGVSRSVDTERWNISGRVARRITRHTTVSAWTSYSDQSSDNTSRNPNNFGDFTAVLGFKYDFDPFRF